MKFSNIALAARLMCRSTVSRVAPLVWGERGVGRRKDRSVSRHGSAGVEVATTCVRCLLIDSQLFRTIEAIAKLKGPALYTYVTYRCSPLEMQT